MLTYKNGLTTTLACVLLSFAASQSALASAEDSAGEKILPVKVIVSSVNSLQYDKHLEVARSSSKYQELTSLFHNARNLTYDIDFNKYAVIGAFMGVKSTGGYNINIVKAIQKEKNNRKYIEVYVNSEIPGPNCMVTMAFTQPAELALIPAEPRTDIIFKESYEVYKCR
ncbi:protease complex subunit PrcB family protein [Zooshikella marina]|uniref:protease complex subunit PrcB family protein n=1 Tax=Zooshikella ganghwensis TaxID=202772 RepID=UPI001BAFD6D6|nr:protease complex subunit PrcB family protein [Zooshikella ganghwensis]MBU2709115.1 protease complex subunit PrcB family protein [Zooshikella ganghwensis]